MQVIIEKQWREIIESELARQSVSRAELARRLGVTPQMVTNYLNVESIRPSPEMMERFLEALELEPTLTVKSKKKRETAKASA